MGTSQCHLVIPQLDEEDRPIFGCDRIPYPSCEDSESTDCEDSRSTSSASSCDGLAVSSDRIPVAGMTSTTIGNTAEPEVAIASDVQNSDAVRAASCNGVTIPLRSALKKTRNTAEPDRNARVRNIDDLEVTVLNLSGEEWLTLCIDPQHSIAELKAQIRERLGIEPLVEIALLYAGSILEDELEIIQCCSYDDDMQLVLTMAVNESPLRELVAKLKGDDAEVLSALKSLIAEPYAWQHEHDVISSLCGLLEGRPDNVRSMVVDAIRKGSDRGNEDVIAELCGYVDSPCSCTRLAAIRSLDHAAPCGHARVLAVVGAHLDDRNSRIQDAAVKVLRRIATHGCAEAVAVIAAHLRKTEPLSGCGYQVTGRSTYDPVKRTALELLVKIAPHGDAVALSALIFYLENSQDADDTVAAIKAITTVAQRGDEQCIAVLSPDQWLGQAKAVQVAARQGVHKLKGRLA